jgi:hypothetical protein
VCELGTHRLLIRGLPSKTGKGGQLNSEMEEVHSDGGGVGGEGPLGAEPLLH